MTNETEIVELRPAYAWDCPTCGTEQFERAVVIELSPEEMEELREREGIEPEEYGDFTMVPESVQCDECGDVFRTVNFREEYEEGEGGQDGEEE